MGVVQLVDGFVGEEAPVGIDASGAEATAGRHEHPQVGVAGHTHQEGGHTVEGRDPVVRLPVEIDELADR